MGRKQKMGSEGLQGERRDLVFFDSTCGLCHGAVRFVVKRDADGSVAEFAPLFGETFEKRIEGTVRKGLPDSLIVLSSEGRLLVRSSAVVRLLLRLGGGWRLAGAVLWIVPKPIRDLGYRLIARVRRSVFDRPKSACPVMSVELRKRFLP